MLPSGSVRVRLGLLLAKQLLTPRMLMRLQLLLTTRMRLLSPLPR